MTKFAVDQFTLTIEGAYVSEASYLGLRPGEVLTEFELNGRVFEFAGTEKGPSGDVCGWYYICSAQRAQIIND